MRTKRLLYGALALVCVCVWGCDGKGEDYEPTGKSTFEWADTGAFQSVPTIVDMQYFGEANGLHSTYFNFQMNPANGQSQGSTGGIVLFHSSRNFTPGTYTFPSIGAGTARGSFQIPPVSQSRSGEINAGSVTVSASGDTYTITFNNVTIRGFQGEAYPFTFSYKGSVYRDDMSKFGAFVPDYPGTSDMELGGTSFGNMGMEVYYFGLAEGSPDIHKNVLRLVSESGGNRLHIDFELYTDTREFATGTYTAAASLTERGDMTFGGQLLLYDESGIVQNVGFNGESVVVAESNGVYTITVDVSAADYNGQQPVALAGTYTGICNYFYDISNN